MTTITIPAAAAEMLLGLDNVGDYTVISREQDGNVHTLQVRHDQGDEYQLTFDTTNLPEDIELTTIPTPFEEVTDA